MNRRIPLAGGLLVALAVSACIRLPPKPPAPVTWAIQERSTAESSVFFVASTPSLNTPSGFSLLLDDDVVPGIGRLVPNLHLREFPEVLRLEWTVGSDQHWIVEDIRPYEMIPAEVLDRARRKSFSTPPLLFRWTFLPQGRVRFSWHACADDLCPERSSPTLRFDGSQVIHGALTDEPPRRRWNT